MIHKPRYIKIVDENGDFTRVLRLHKFPDTSKVFISSLCSGLKMVGLPGKTVCLKLITFTVQTVAGSCRQI
ncbi:hypothetical protein F9Z35_0025 [Neisseria gonorrhoeae]|nr:hypothetical protein F9Z35_0025 [Neisseria gonorrhoeae]